MARFLGRISLSKLVRNWKKQVSSSEKNTRKELQVSKKRVPLQTYHLNDGLNGTKTPSLLHAFPLCISSIYVINSTEALKVHLIGEKGMRMTRSRVIYNKVRAYIIICATPFLLISRQNTSRDSCVFSVKDYLCGDTISNHLKRQYIKNDV